MLLQTVVAGLGGPQGATGLSGSQGATGLTGAAGPQGATGLTGAAGPQGPIGLTGAAGAAGPQGPPGPAGATGSTSDRASSLFGTNTNTARAGNGRECTLGEVILSAGSVATGAPANGQLLPIRQNQALFALLGTMYGGDGTSTFALPDLRSVAPNGLTYSMCMSGIFPSSNW